MRAYGFRLPVVLTTALAVLALLFSLQIAYAHDVVLHPLTRALMEEQGVQSVTVNRTAEGIAIDVKEGLVPNLQTAYDTLYTTAENVLGSRAFTLNIEGDPTPALEQEFQDDFNEIVLTGIATGQYQTMQSSFNAEAKRLNLQDAQVTEGDTFPLVFVELVSGKSYLYEVISRQVTQSSKSGTASTG